MTASRTGACRYRVCRHWSSPGRLRNPSSQTWEWPARFPASPQLRLEYHDGGCGTERRDWKYRSQRSSRESVAPRSRRDNPRFSKRQKSRVAKERADIVTLLHRMQQERSFSRCVIDSVLVGPHTPAHPPLGDALHDARRGTSDHLRQAQRPRRRGHSSPVASAVGRTQSAELP